MKQCKVLDMGNEFYHENSLYHGGILLEDGSVICGCCGGLFPADEQDETWHLEKIYDDWINISEEICGDD